MNVSTEARVKEGRGRRQRELRKTQVRKAKAGETERRKEREFRKPATKGAQANGVEGRKTSIKKAGKARPATGARRQRSEEPDEIGKA